MIMEKLLDEFVKRSQKILREDLAGIYLHGSAVMGCFNPEKSDVDLIVIVSRALAEETRRAFMEMIVELNAQGPAKGIEMSIVTKDVCRPFVYPTPFELHFSAGHLRWYLEDPDGYLRKMRGADKDLAAHFTIIRARGRCLYGAPVEEVFGEVPRQDYLDSICFDVAEAREEITEYPMYLILNLARVLAFCRDGAVFSKKEGGEWAIKHLPEEFHPLVRTALKEYMEGGNADYDPECSKRYAEYMLEQIDMEK